MITRKNYNDTKINLFGGEHQIQVLWGCFKLFICVFNIFFMLKYNS